MTKMQKLLNELEDLKEEAAKRSNEYRKKTFTIEDKLTYSGSFDKNIPFVEIVFTRMGPDSKPEPTLRLAGATDRGLVVGIENLKRFHSWLSELLEDHVIAEMKKFKE